jgi:tRNA 2-selenouridine synthase
MDNDLHQILIEDTPFLDVRAEVEYLQGTMPTSVNLPILTDQERHRVGFCYKQQGSIAATTLGHQLVSGDTRDQRIASWTEFLSTQPKAHLYCWRGGQRSEIAQLWLKEAGFEVPRINGGYKALRQFLLRCFEHIAPLIVVSGYTGVGKTDFINQLSESIDLEALAHHRGSAFGKRVSPQPVQADFENSLAIDLLKKKHINRFLFVEDESRLIGRLQVPHLFKNAMDAAAIVVLQDSLKQRVERILQDYIVVQFNELTAVHGDEALEQLSNQLLAATDGIKKRLGGVNHKTVRQMVESALVRHGANDIQGHKEWIEFLLVHYYDPMYNFQLQQKSDRIVFRGTWEEIAHWHSKKAGDI